MDPTACLTRILEAIDDDDYSEAAGAAEDLLVWLAKNGDPPSFNQLYRNQLQTIVFYFCHGVQNRD